MRIVRLFWFFVAVNTFSHMSLAENNPVANPESVVVEGNARFTVLSESLLRIEYAPDGKFEDRASYFVVNRELPEPEFHDERVGDSVRIRTTSFQITYTPDGKPFSKDNLKVLVNAGEEWVDWELGTAAPNNLGGTSRTLDGVSGASDLEPGWLTRDGWTFIDDSTRVVFDDSDWPWAVGRTTDGGRCDWYLCAYGTDYIAGLRQITSIAGRIPLPPRYAFGAWWSRYWAYSDDELKKLVTEFEQNDVPLDVLVIDMDWHLEGWTGYTWNPEYFPDPQAFLDWTDERGLKVPLNLHPADGVGQHEAVFAEFAQAVGVDPATTEKIPFDCTDKNYMRAYFDVLHRPLEAMGVDFWWIDWQQGTDTKIPGLDPLPWLNYCHWSDMERNPARDARPLLFSRWGGYGNHRYQVGFSGDTFCNWPSLAFQPFFTATAGNVGYAYWSHDIGGHQPGPVDPELYTRWIQWGALSPILRTHTTKNPDAERRIWEFAEPYYSAMKNAWKLRYELVPYLYMSARQAYETSLPLCRPLYLHWPEADEAYKYHNEYLLGDQLLVMPVTQPMDETLEHAFVQMWIPPGEWVNWFTGRRYTGPREISFPVGLAEIPLFARAGAIIPAAENLQRASDTATSPLVVHVFPGEHNRIRYYEDDGMSSGYLKSDVAWTTIEGSARGNSLRLLVDRTEGGYDGMTSQRAIVARFHDVLPPDAVTLNGQPVFPANDADATGWFYDPDTFELIVRTEPRLRGQQTALRVMFPKLPNSRELLRRGIRGELGSLGYSIRMLKNTNMASRISGILKQLVDFGVILKENPQAAEMLAETLTADSGAIFAAINEPRLEGVLSHATAKVLGFTGTFSPDPESGALRFVASVDPALFDLTGAAVEQVVTIGSETATSEATLADGVTRFECDAPDAATSSSIPQSTNVFGAFEITPVGQATTRLVVREHLFPSINGWWIAGPFERESAAELDSQFRSLQNFDEEQHWPGKDDKSAKLHRVVRAVNDATISITDEMLVNFRDVFGWRPADACAYAYCDIWADSDTQARLAIGSDDGCVIWLKGEQVFEHNEGRAYTSREDFADITLKAGMNRLVVRVDQFGGDWAFAIHVEGRDGEFLEDRIRVSLPE